ncbi:MAG TPA: stage II sporulation protein P, partial [Candidatus Enterenecus avicola]|nr:stage II sporulation protein P [Candidatus Enterenecus avicola]
TAPDGIIPSTLKAGTSAAYCTYGNVTVYNHTDYTLDVKALLEAAPKLTPAQDGPDILIYHSHATEAYTMDGTDVYEESDSYRTLNTEQNMVRIGTEMTKILEASGLEVIHDTTLYDYPDYNDAYNRSSQAVKEILDQYPSIRLVIDVHRDALVASDGTIYKTVAGTVDNCAQVMMVMGTDALGQTHPNWRVNLSLATSIQKALADKWSTLARPIVLRTSRFNQHYSTGCLLVEVGSHGNTLQEAITAARLYARTIADLFQTQ